MADSTTHLDQIQASQAQHDVTANQLFDAASPAMLFGRHAPACIGLTWAYYGGAFSVGGIPTTIPNGTLTLSPSTTNYIYSEPGGSPTTDVVFVTTTPPSGWPGPLSGTKVALYAVVTGTSTVSSYTDYRVPAAATGGSGTPGGSNTQIQYNDSGAFNGDSRLTFNETTKITTGQFAIDANAINAQTGTTYTIQATDNGKVVTLSNGSGITVSVPSGLPVGFSCICIQIGAGQVTFAPSGSPSPTINPSSTLKIASQHGAASLISYASDVYNLSGNITA